MSMAAIAGCCGAFEPVRLALGAFVAVAALADGSAAASDFDFYVLSLSWSPSYCAAEGEEANRHQCAEDRPYAFVVHGLWPQFENGWPEFCGSSEPDRVPDALVGSLLDIMPSAGLIGHQWRKHGSCSGLTQDAYFSLVRQAQEKIEIPNRFKALDAHLTVAPEEVEEAFIDANPALPDAGIAVTCDSHYLREVRICMTKELEFRSCEEVDERSCELPRAAMPPAR